jgi:hypothetical protein
MLFILSVFTSGYRYAECGILLSDLEEGEAFTFEWGRFVYSHEHNS